MKLEKIELKSFRAYKNQEFKIDPEKNIILIHGNNGFGKTSFFDGVEWGFTGKIERYSTSSKEKNEYPMLKNYFANKDEDGFSSIQLSGPVDFKRSIKQTGESDFNEGTLSINQNYLEKLLIKEAYFDKVSFSDRFNFSHLLSQELLSSFIRDVKDTDRYQIIVKLFGLENYEKFNPAF